MMLVGAVVINVFKTSISSSLATNKTPFLDTLFPLLQIYRWCRNSRRVLDTTSEEINQTQETSDIIQCLLREKRCN